MEGQLSTRSDDVYNLRGVRTPLGAPAEAVGVALCLPRLRLTGFLAFREVPGGPFVLSDRFPIAILNFDTTGRTNNFFHFSTYKIY